MSQTGLLTLCTLLSLACMGAASCTAGGAGEDGQAAYGPWRSCKIGGGGYIQDVVLSPSNPHRIYTYVDVGGVYRSDDGGRRWRMMNADLPQRPAGNNVRSLIVDPRDEDHLVAAVGDVWASPEGVYVSRDGGLSWRRTLVAPFAANGAHRWAGPLLARSPSDPDLVLVATVGEGVWRSEDNGETWQQCGATDLYPSHLLFSRSHPDRVWLCAPHHQKHMHGQLRTFQGGFFRSDDAGRTWRRASAQAPSEVLEDPKDPGLLYGILDGCVHASQDAGESWRLFAEGLPERTSPVPPFPSGEGHPHPSEDHFQALAAGPDFVLCASTTGTLYRLQCGESRWRRVERQALRQPYQGEQWFGGEWRFGMALASIVVDPRDPDHWFLTDWFALYQSLDAGRSWELTMDGVEVTCINVFQQDPSDPAVVHLGMLDNGYFYSEDGGARFRSVREGITNNIKCITLCPAAPQRLYAVGSYHHHWESSQVFISDDRGRTWRRSPMHGLPDRERHRRNTIVASPDDPDLVYLCASGPVGPEAGGVYVSEDGGESWRWIGEGLPEGEGLFSHGILGASGRELAVGRDGTLICISRHRRLLHRWPAGAARWERVEVELAGSPSGVVADPEKPGRFFLAAGGVYRSDDGGRTWKQVLADRASDVAVDLARPARVAAGTADGVALSEDGGETWRILDRRLPRRSHNLVSFAGDHLLAGSSGSGAFWMPLP